MSSRVFGVWSLTVEPKKAEILVPERYDIHLTQVTLGDVPAKSKDKSTSERVRLQLSYPNKATSIVTYGSGPSTHTDQTVLAVLQRTQVENACLNLVLVAGDRVVLEVAGPCAVHLTGNLLEVPQERLPASDSKKRSRVISESLTGADTNETRVLVNNSRAPPTKKAKADTPASAPRVSPAKPMSNKGVVRVPAKPTIAAKKGAHTTQPRIKAEPVDASLVLNDAASLDGAISDPSLGLVTTSRAGGKGRAGVAADDTGAEEDTSQASADDQDNVTIKDWTVGTGKAQAELGDTVHVLYKYMLDDEKRTVVDAAQECPVPVTLGENSFLPAIDRGLVGMRVNGERMITIPPAYAYADEQFDKIPPLATMIFHCKMVEIVKGE